MRKFNSTGFKCGSHYVNGVVSKTTEKPWYSESGVLLHKYALFVKKISRNGVVTSINWGKSYNRLLEALDIDFPGKYNSKVNVFNFSIFSIQMLPRLRLA